MNVTALLGYGQEYPASVGKIVAATEASDCGFLSRNSQLGPSSYRIRKLFAAGHNLPLSILLLSISGSLT